MDVFKDLITGVFIKVLLMVTKMRKNLTPQKRGIVKLTMIDLYDSH